MRKALADGKARSASKHARIVVVFPVPGGPCKRQMRESPWDEEPNSASTPARCEGFKPCTACGDEAALTSDAVGRVPGLGVLGLLL